MMRSEHPRPQFARKDWLNLNGVWEFEYDDADRGLGERWQEGNRPFTQSIQVPFAFQSKLSGIGNNDFHDRVWYRRKLTIPESFWNKRILLHFGAVDYEASVWVNGQLVASHEGGHTPFSADITHALAKDGAENVLVVRARDYSRDVTLPRGKQYWKPDSASIFYTRTTGIWQTVWLEAVSSIHLHKVRMTPDIDKNTIELRFNINGELEGRDLRLKVNISFEGKPVTEDLFSVRLPHETRSVGINDFNDHGLGNWWSPEKPHLYDVTFTLIESGAIERDKVDSYFGMRKISIENGKFCLNNRPYFQKLVLDQGYFPEGNLTPPSDEAIKRDVELTKEMGFNGARKHQKLEDPRYLYWCDKLGLLVWSEAANSYDYSEDYVRRFTAEWQASMERDYNHPCIAVWVPLNESWGVPNIQIDKRQEQHALTMYHLTKSLDPMRPVISNDGWEMVETDLFNIHDYEWRREVLTDRYSTIQKATTAMPANRQLSVAGYSYAGQPILITEFGGIAYKKSDWEGWGYSGAVNDEDYVQRLKAVIEPLQQSEIVQGYCYTQLTDVEQEINGLLTYDRQPKIPLEIIKAMNAAK